MSEGARPRVAVGIPSFREADTIADVVQRVDRGLSSWPGVEGRIVNVDGESDDRSVRDQTLLFRHLLVERAGELPAAGGLAGQGGKPSSA